MKPLRREQIEDRVYGMTFPGHEGRIQALEKSTMQALGLDFALLEGGGTIPAGPTTDKYIFDLSAERHTDDPDNWTNSADVFTLGLHNFTGGIVNPGNHQGVSIIATGTYLMLQRLQVISSSASYTGTKALSVEYTKDGVNGVDYDFIYGDPFHAIEGWSQNTRVFSLPNDVAHGVVPPSGPIALQSQNSTSQSFDVAVGLLIIRLPFALPF